MWAPVASTFLDKFPYVVHRHPRFGKIIRYFFAGPCREKSRRDHRIAPGVHPLRADEIRALRELRRQFPDLGYVFATERGVRSRPMPPIG
jgi:hypothetical protein